MKKIIMKPILILAITLPAAVVSCTTNKSNILKFKGIDINLEKNYYNKRDASHPSYNMQYKQGYLLGSINIRMYSKPNKPNIFPLTDNEFRELITKIEDELSYGPEIFSLKMIKIGNYYSNIGASATFDSKTQIIDINDEYFYDTNVSKGKTQIFSSIMKSLQHEYGHFISYELLQNEKKGSFDSEGLYSGEEVVPESGNDEAPDSIDIGEASGVEKIYASTINKKFINKFKDVLKYSDLNDVTMKTLLKRKNWTNEGTTYNAVSNVYNVADIWKEFIANGPITDGFLKKDYVYGYGQGYSGSIMDRRDYVQRGYDELFAKRFTTMFLPGGDEDWSMYQTQIDTNHNDNFQFFKDYIYEKNENSIPKDERRSFKFFNLIGNAIGFKNNKNISLLKRANNNTYYNKKALMPKIVIEKQQILQKIEQMIEAKTLAISEIPKKVFTSLESSHNLAIDNNKVRIGGFLNKSQITELGIIDSSINNHFGKNVKLKTQDGYEILAKVFKTNYKYKKTYKSQMSDYEQLSDNQGKYFWITNNGDNKAFVIDDGKFNEKGKWDLEDFADLDRLVDKKLEIISGNKSTKLISVKNGDELGTNNFDLGKTWTYIPNQEIDQKINFKTYQAYVNNTNPNDIYATIKEYNFPK